MFLLPNIITLNDIRHRQVYGKYQETISDLKFILVHKF